MDCATNYSCLISLAIRSTAKKVLASFSTVIECLCIDPRANRLLDSYACRVNNDDLAGACSELHIVHRTRAPGKPNLIRFSGANDSTALEGRTGGVVDSIPFCFIFTRPMPDLAWLAMLWIIIYFDLYFAGPFSVDLEGRRGCRDEIKSGLGKNRLPSIIQSRMSNQISPEANGRDRISSNLQRIELALVDEGKSMSSASLDGGCSMVSHSWPVPRVWPVCPYISPPRQAQTDGTFKFISIASRRPMAKSEAMINRTGSLTLDCEKHWI
ncbi:hypothetical protein C8J56DRAFT_1119820 [Mycena floridula]|nr:hypothetical protein C8J56DRAFT_1119820 [Mycena floridula]